MFRREITADQRKEAFREVQSDLNDNTLLPTAISWTDAFREAESLGSAHSESLGVRSIDLLHVGLALTFRTREFLTFDGRQAGLAKVAGLKVGP